jgi:hypothetical protein
VEGSLIYVAGGDGEDAPSSDGADDASQGAESAPKPLGSPIAQLLLILLLFVLWMIAMTSRR